MPRASISLRHHLGYVNNSCALPLAVIPVTALGNLGHGNEHMG